MRRGRKRFVHPAIMPMLVLGYDTMEIADAIHYSREGVCSTLRREAIRTGAETMTSNPTARRVHLVTEWLVSEGLLARDWRERVTDMLQ